MCKGKGGGVQKKSRPVSHRRERGFRNLPTNLKSPLEFMFYLTKNGRPAKLAFSRHRWAVLMSCRTVINENLHRKTKTTVSLQISRALAQPGPGWVTGSLSCSVMQRFTGEEDHRTARGAAALCDCDIQRLQSAESWPRDILLPRPPPPQPSFQTLVESPSSSLPAAD